MRRRWRWGRPAGRAPLVHRVVQPLEPTYPRHQMQVRQHMPMRNAKGKCLPSQEITNRGRKIPAVVCTTSAARATSCQRTYRVNSSTRASAASARPRQSQVSLDCVSGKTGPWTSRPFDQPMVRPNSLLATRHALNVAHSETRYQSNDYPLAGQMVGALISAPSPLDRTLSCVPILRVDYVLTFTLRSLFHRIRAPKNSCVSGGLSGCGGRI